ncbi:restriction endonuclease subunit S [Vibrio jasicida]|uniref:restriction endonuclease subunit S n=1 Tax=Vibrio jasicida TaxID=766224 RepID=UPI0005778C9D|nr:restriction endonuclease subunit S [Vibrio jasicida]
MSELPKAWKATLLNEVVDKIVGGGTPSKSVPSYYEGDIPWMTVKDMNKSYLTDTIDHITQEAIDNSSTNVIPAGTPIIATRMSLGKIVRASFDSAINQDLKALFVNRDVDDYYFEYWYRSQGLKIESLGTGTTVKGVRLEVINALEFPLAPLAEQKRIVKKLDEVLAQVDTIKARLDGIPDLLKRFRQSVLASAVSGKLTEEWRGVGSEPFGKQVKLGELLKDGPQNGLYKPSRFYGDGTKIFRIDSFYDGELVDWETIKRVDLEEQEVGKYRVNVDDVLINRVNSIEYLGKCALVRELPERAVFESNIMRMSIDTEKALPAFVTIFLRSIVGLQELRKNAKLAVNQASINQTDVKNCSLRLPKIEEQKEIVRLVDQYFAFADTIEAQVKKAQARVDNLTQSILAKAFRGELVDQDPNDEPADKLLERIAEARKEAEALAKAAKKAEAAKKRAAKSA